MPEKTAETLATALERMRDPKLGEQEHAVAVEEFVKANAALLDKLGVERRNAPSRILGLLISTILVIAVTVSMVFSVSQAVKASNAAEKASDTASKVQVQAAHLHLLQRDNVFSNRQNCERANDSRAASIRNLHGDVTTLKAELRLWEVALAGATSAELETLEGTPVYAALTADLLTLKDGIARKEGAITNSIESQKEVAIHPGSPRADCVAAYPLAAETLGPPKP